MEASGYENSFPKSQPLVQLAWNCSDLLVFSNPSSEISPPWKLALEASHLLKSNSRRGGNASSNVDKFMRMVLQTAKIGN